MKIEVFGGDVLKAKADLLVVGWFEGEKRASGATGSVDLACDWAISSAIADGDFNGKPGESVFFRAGKGIAAKRVLVVGMGKVDAVTAESVRKAALPAMKVAKSVKAKVVVFLLNGAGGGVDQAKAADALALGAVLSSYEHDRYKAEKGHEVAVFRIVVGKGDDVARVRLGAARGEAVGSAINRARDLVAAAPSDLRPDGLERAAKALSGGKVRVKVLDAKALAKMKAGGLLAVGRGSEVHPRLIVVEYRGGSAKGPWTALVGKGITFDTGGISLKKGEGMEKMKYDMAGAAAVLATVQAAVALKIPRNIVALVPAAENMPSGTAYRPGDVLRMLDGKTVEVQNTDAEGRLILADAIAYAKKAYRPAEIVDVATLTGACVVALGSVRTGMMGNDAAMVARMKVASERSGEKAWELPMDEEYREQLKSDVADLRNVGGGEAGTITGGWFLREFVGETPWVHFDIAGTAWTEKERNGYAQGPTGAPVRLLVDYLDSASR